MLYFKEVEEKQLKEIKKRNKKVKKRGEEIYYYNFPVSFDIETTSYTENENKYAWMYIWMLDIDGLTLYGRTWEEYFEFLELLKKIFKLNEKNVLLIYVHNLEFEMQFIRKRFKWIENFSLKNRVPLRWRSSDGFEFRCSYLLTGVKLEKLGEEVKVNKMVGDLDYSLIRHSETELTEEELKYCENDVIIIEKYIRQQIKVYKKISAIPLTKTGKVRKELKKATIYSSGNNKTYINRDYVNIIKTCEITPHEYYIAEKAFQGGFTHSNPNKSNVLIHDKIFHVDFASSYPAVMVSSSHFPMKKIEYFKNDNKKYFDYLNKGYCIIAEVEYNGLNENVNFEHYITESKIYNAVNAKSINGRIVSCETFKIVITDIDYKLIEMFYNYDNFKVLQAYVYRPGRLPKNLVNFILSSYEKKTLLKHNEDKKEEYKLAKENINSIYGISVQKVSRDEILYNNDIWEEHKINYDGENRKKYIEAIKEYCEDSSRYLSYLWGVYVTATARYRLLVPIIKEIKNDYLYSDTDSIFFIDKTGDHITYIYRYNAIIEKLMNEAMTFYKFKEDYYRPKGQTLGIFEFEKNITHFKTLGAKRYMMTESDGETSITVSGLPKQAVNYILKNGGYDFFRFGMYIPKEYTGKKLKSYIDEEFKIDVKDYTGKISEVHELSSLHLSDCEFCIHDCDEEIINFINYCYGKWEDKE